MLGAAILAADQSLLAQDKPLERPLRGGTMLAQKGESGPAETQAAEKAIKLLGGKLRQVIPVNLPGVVDDRFLILIDKSAATPPKYPRKPGLPVKRPL